MQELKHEMVMDADIDAPRRLLSAVLNLAVADLALAKGHPHRIDAERFIFGDRRAVSESYLMMLGLDPERFRRALREKMVDTVA